MVVIICLFTDLAVSKTQSFWYPNWFTKDLGTGADQNVQVGSQMMHIPVTSTDTPVHVNLISEPTELAEVEYPKKVNFLELKNKQCLLKIPLRRGGKRYERKFVGISEGVFPYPENQNRFVVCHKKRDGNVECLEIDCPKGTYFDAEEGKCRYKKRNLSDATFLNKAARKSIIEKTLNKLKKE